MADAEDKEKAEKVAAARKRYEQLKKQKTQKGTSTKKEKKAKGDAGDPSKAPKDTENAKDEEDVHAAGVEDVAEEHEGAELASSADADATSRIEQLEKDNQRLQKELQENIDSQASSDLATENEKLKSEVASLQRQNAQLEARRRRTSSVASPSGMAENLNAQLASKSNTIESLELELSNLRHTLTTSEARASDLENQAKTAEDSTKAAEQRLTDLKASLESAKSENAAKGTEEEKAKEGETRIALLTSDLSAAQHNAVSANSRIESLEKKIETLNTLHKEAESRFSGQTKTSILELEKARSEASDLQRRLNTMPSEKSRLRDPNARKDVDGDSGGLEEIEEEERGQLLARVRQLERDLYEARSGHWLQKRKELQGGLDDHENPSSPGQFDDVDLDTPAAGAGLVDRRPQGGGYGAFAQNMLNAFTGAGGSGAGGGAQRGRGHGRAQSYSKGGAGFDDDMDFDEDAFAAAHESEQKARLERVKDIKRGLGGWKGWRMDLVDVRGGAMAGVFDV